MRRRLLGIQKAALLVFEVLTITHRGVRVPRSFLRIALSGGLGPSIGAAFVRSQFAMDALLWVLTLALLVQTKLCE